MGVLTVKERLRTAVSIHSLDPTVRPLNVLDVLDLLELTSHPGTKIGNGFVHSLLGGQIRGISIGCKLVAAPHILVLDEPASRLGR